MLLELRPENVPPTSLCLPASHPYLLYHRFVAIELPLSYFALVLLLLRIIFDIVLISGIHLSHSHCLNFAHEPAWSEPLPQAQKQQQQRVQRALPHSLQTETGLSPPIALTTCLRCPLVVGQRHDKTMTMTLVILAQYVVVSPLSEDQAHSASSR